MVQALVTDRPNTSFGISVHIGSPDRGVNNPDLLGSKNLVKRGTEFAIAIMNEISDS